VATGAHVEIRTIRLRNSQLFERVRDLEDENRELKILINQALETAKRSKLERQDFERLYKKYFNLYLKR
jgi:hypothetical protein